MRNLPKPIKIIMLIFVLIIFCPLILINIKPYHSYSGSMNYLSTKGAVEVNKEILIYTDIDGALDTYEAKCLAKLSNEFLIITQTPTYE